MNESSDVSNISTLTSEDLLGLLSCPQEEIVSEVKNLIKDQFSSTSDKWLVSGLMDYFFATNSKRILDILVGAPEPHCKYLMERICSGIRNSGDRFQYLSLLLYAVSRNPPPVWVHKIPDAILKDLLDILCSSREFDISVLVSGVMVLVLVLPTLPFECTKYLSKIFDCFWKLLNWSPTREQDTALKPYLQVAVYSLFHRLYALYPCNLLGFLRTNMVGQPNNDKAWFLSTLRPMLERVRFHPLLVTETKDTEIFKTRWTDLETSDLIHECAKLCLDPIQEICEETYLSRCTSDRSDFVFEAVPETSDCYILCSSENSFWSPGAAQSPKTANASVPHTPVYALQSLHSTGNMMESPPEAAVEATPETTPFTSPASFFPDQQMLPHSKVFAVDESLLESNPNKQFSPVKREQISSMLGSKPSQYFLKSEKSHLLQNKLQEVKQQRIARQIEGTVTVPFSKDVSNSIEDEKQNSTDILNTSNSKESKMESTDKESTKENYRQRKLAVVIGKTWENVEGSVDLFTEDNVSLESESPGNATNENDQIEFEKVKDSEKTRCEGLGLPSRGSMTELMKNVKTNRIRFLSQCGPPPNISLLGNFESKRNASPVTTSIYTAKRKSRSCPDIFTSKYNSFCTSPKLELTTAHSVSQVKNPVDSIEIGTQTEEAPVIDPYEQLLEALLIPMNGEHKDTKRREQQQDMPSPHQLLDQFIGSGCEDNPPPSQEMGWHGGTAGVNNKTRNHSRLMQCLLMLERYKREVHAERNRRLLGKIKRLNSLQEKDEGLRREKNLLKEETVILQRELGKQREKSNIVETKLTEMFEKMSSLEAQEKRSKASFQRDHLWKECESLHKENINLTKELEFCRSELRERERQLKVHLRHSAENSELRSKVENLNSRILIMGEIQIDIQQQLEKYKYTQCQVRTSDQTKEKMAFAQRVEELEHVNKAQEINLDASSFRIKELEDLVASFRLQKDEHRREVELVNASWRERCDALDKRNEELCSVNITLERQMTQLLCHNTRRVVEDEKEATGLGSSTVRDGFPLSVDPCKYMTLPSTEEPSSFIAQMSSTDFHPLGSPQS